MSGVIGLETVVFLQAGAGLYFLFLLYNIGIYKLNGSV